jgi:phenylacetate-CoA ligase
MQRLKAYWEDAMDVQMFLRLLAALSRQRRHAHWTRAHVQTYQARALQQLRAHTYANSPFYQQFHAGMTDRPLHELPVLTKAMLMEQFDTVVADRAIRLRDVQAHLAAMQAGERFADRYWINATSGSTGQRGIFLFDRDEWIAVLASFARAHDLAGLQISLAHRMKLAFVASTTPWHMSAQAGATLRSWWTPALRLDASEPLPTTVERLNAWQPEMLVAYASMARILANEQLAGRLRIAPRLVFTSSEVLTDAARRMIEAAWGQQLFNQYAATETGSIAAECEQHRGMHVFEDQLILEVVDAENRPVPPGVFGAKVLVTTLWSRTFPLIRYEITDSVRLAAEPCPCGRIFSVIDAVQGRAEDVLRFRTIVGTDMDVHPNVFHRIMDTIPTAGWQIIQEPDRIRVMVSARPDRHRDADIADAVRRALAERGADVPPIFVEHVDTIPKTASGKAPLITTHTGAAYPAMQTSR